MAKKTKNEVFYSFVYWEVWSMSWPRHIFASTIFSGDILQNVKNKKVPSLLTMCFFLRIVKIREFERAHFVDTWFKLI